MGFFPEESSALLPGARGATGEDISKPWFRGGAHELWAAPARGVLGVGAGLSMAAGAADVPIDTVLGTDLQSQAFAGHDALIRMHDSLTLAPDEIGVAAHALGGAGEFLTQVGLGGGNPALAVGAQELNTAAELAAQGVAPGVAVTAGVTEAAGSALAFHLPGLGTNGLQRILFGAGGMAALGAVGTGSVSAVLKAAGYPDQASQYDAWNGESWAANAIAGGMFGAFTHLTAPAMPLRRPPQHVLDATAAIADHAHRIAGTAPGTPQDATALDQHAKQMSDALTAVLGDRPVTSSVQPDLFWADPHRAAWEADRQQAAIEAVGLEQPVDMLPADAYVVNPIDPNASPEVQLAQIHALTDVNKPIVDAAIAQVNKEFGITGNSNVKADENIISKASRPSTLARKPWHRVEHVRDTFRFKSVLENISDLGGILTRVLELTGATVVKSDTPKVLEPLEWGWRIASFDLRMPNGQLVEYYTPVRELEAQKNTHNHELFEKWRNKKPQELTLEEVRESAADKAESRLTYDAAWQRYLARTGTDEAAVRTALTKADASAASRMGGQSYISPNVGKSRVNVPSGPSIPTKPSEGSITATPPSGARVTDTDNLSISVTSGPSIAETAPIANSPHGNAGEVQTERGMILPFHYVAVEAADVVTSHTDALGINPAYPAELQPRDRARADSETQISAIENNINPERLAESVMATDGAPIVGADGVVESGNARAIAVRRAYGSGKADAYRAWLDEEAARFGLDQAAVARMREPFLVRVVDTPHDRAEFARQANESSTAPMNAAAQARSDAARMPSLSGLVTKDDGSINMDASRGFIYGFMKDAVGPKGGDLLDKLGGLGQAGLARIRNAVFYRAYGDIDLVGLLAESTDSGVKNILNGMMRSAAAVARLADNIKAGARHDVPVIKDLVDAAHLIAGLKNAGQTLKQYEDSQLFGSNLAPTVRNLAVGLEENARAPKRVEALIDHMVATVDGAGDPRQPNLFGEAPPPRPDETVSDAINAVRKTFEVKTVHDLFASPTLSSAIEIAATKPGMMVLNADGIEVSATQALAEADAAIRQAKELEPGIDAAVACAMQQMGEAA